MSTSSRRTSSSTISSSWATSLRTRISLDFRALLDDDLVLGDGHKDLVFADLGFGCLPAFDRHPLDVDLLAPLGHPDLLTVGPHSLADVQSTGLTLARSGPELLFGPLHPQLVLVPEVVPRLGDALGRGVVLVELPALAVDVAHRDARVPLARRLVGRGAVVRAIAAPLAGGLFAPQAEVGVDLALELGRNVLIVVEVRSALDVVLVS